MVTDFPQTCTPKPVIKLTVAQKDYTTAGVPPFPESQDCLEDVGGTGSKTWTLSYPNAGHGCAVLTSGTLTTTSVKRDANISASRFQRTRTHAVS